MYKAIFTLILILILFHFSIRYTSDNSHFDMCATFAPKFDMGAAGGRARAQGGSCPLAPSGAAHGLKMAFSPIARVDVLIHCYTH